MKTGAMIYLIGALFTFGMAISEYAYLNRTGAREITKLDMVGASLACGIMWPVVLGAVVHEQSMQDNEETTR